MGERDPFVAVLAGGRGRRLGGSKASVKLAGRPLISYPLKAARDAGIEAIVVAKQASLLPELVEPVLLEPDQPSHPLCGIARALSFARERSPRASIVLVACDMPFVTSRLLAWLAGLEGPAVAVLGGRIEATLGRYIPSDLPILREALGAECPLREVVARLSPRQIVGERELSRFGDPARLCFNVNRPEDLQKAEEWLSRPSS
jgi:molybdenum cofactor guanylyltransferase